jgi:hypothetical protein
MTASKSSTGRSIWAVVAGLIVVVGLAIVGDVISQKTGLYPMDGSTATNGAFAIFLAYRLVFTVLGGYVTARLAPQNPIKHAVILGAIGTAGALAGVIAMTVKNMPGPVWYPWALVITAVPATWLGAKIHQD